MSALRAVLFDWAGTTVDHGCFAPVAVFVAIFAERGIAVTDAEARAPMGMFKRDHIRAMLDMPSIAGQWRERFGRSATEADIDALYADAIPRQIDAIGQHARLIDGTAQAVERLRAWGMAIGSCTGYTRAMMQALTPLAAEQGYAPDALVCPDDVPAGRPAPWMAFANAMQLGVYPISAWVKVGDTPVDMQEGRNAGMWSVGVAATGSLIGLSAEALAALPAADRAARIASAGDSLRAAGAHLVIDSIAQLDEALAMIEERAVRGERP